MGEITRRDAMKTALKAGAYAAPVILGSTHVSAADRGPSGQSLLVNVAAAATETPTAATCTGGTPHQYLTNVAVSVTGTAFNTAFDVYVVPLGIQPPGTFVFLGTLTTDATGNAFFTGQTLPVTAPGSSSVAITVGTPVRLVAVGLAPINVNASVQIIQCRTAARGIQSYTVTQKPTPATCAGGTPPQYVETLAFQLADYQPHTTYDVYISADTVTPAGTFTKAGSFTTDAQGAATFAGVATLTLSVVGYPTSLDTNIVYSGAPATPPVAYHDLTTLTNLSC